MSSYSESLIYPTYTSNNAQLDQSTSVMVTNQLPEFIQAEYPKFIAFLKSYYEFLNNTNPPVEVPLITDRPAGTVGSYGADTGNYQVGEVVNQYAEVTDGNLITCSAYVFAVKLNPNGTKSIVLFKFSGRDIEFIPGYNIVGQTSGAKYQIADSVVSPTASAEAATRSLLNYQDIDTTLDDYIKYIKNEMAINLPEKLADGVDKRKIIKHMREFYQSRGTENSFKFLFKILYGDDVELYYPEEDMLRASDAEWEQRSTIRTTVPATDLANNANIPSPSSLVNRELTGQDSGAKAIVNKVQILQQFGADILELELQNITGTFKADEQIKTTNLGDGSIYEIQVIPGITDITIHNGGSNYHTGDIIGVSSGGSFAAGASLIVDEVDEIGQIKSIKIEDPGVRYTTNPTLDVSSVHTADRFAEGPLETIYYEDFTGPEGGYTNTTFFSAYDNRGFKSNASFAPAPTTKDTTPGNPFWGGIIDPSDKAAIKSGSSDRPSEQWTKHLPVSTYGLKAYWKMNQWHPKPLKIKSYSANVASRYYNVIYDETGNEYHAISPRHGAIDDSGNSSANTTGSAGYGENFSAVPGFGLFQNSVDFATDDSVTDGNCLITRTGNTGLNDGVNGIIGYNGQRVLTGAGTGTSTSSGQAAGGISLMDHYDIEKDQQQTWTFWYKPTANIGTQARLISRDASAYWALICNPQGADPQSNVNSSGTAWVGGSSANPNLRFQTRLEGRTPSTGTLAVDFTDAIAFNEWHFFCIQEDYVNAQTHFTMARTDGYVLTANTDDYQNWTPRSTFQLDKTANASYGSGAVPPGVGEGGHTITPHWSKRAVKLAENSESFAKTSGHRHGGSFGGAPGKYDEVRYYNRILDVQEIVALIRNPGANTSTPTLADEGWHVFGIPSDRDLRKHTYKFNDHYKEHTLDGVYTLPEGGTRAGQLVNANDYTDIVTGNVVFQQGDGTVTSNDDYMWMMHNQNIPYDPEKIYRSKIRLRALSSAEDGTTNTYAGFVWVSNDATTMHSVGGLDTLSAGHYHLLNGTGMETGSIPHRQWVELTSFMTGFRNSNSFRTSGSGGYNWGASGFGGSEHGGYTLNDYSVYPTAKSTLSYPYDPGAQTWAQPSINLTGGYFRPMMLLSHPSSEESRIIVDYFKVEAANDAFITASPGAVMNWPGKSVGDNGKLSVSPTSEWSANYLQDDEYYQIFSYVIKSGLGVDTYRNVIEELAHPAGTKLFGQVSIRSFTSANTVNIPETVGSELGNLLLRFFGGHNSISEYADVPIAGKNIGYRTEFKDYELGETPLGGSPGWIPYNDARKEAMSKSPHGGYSSMGGALSGGSDYVANASGYETSTIKPTKYGAIWTITGNGSFLVSANTRLPTAYDDPAGGPAIDIRDVGAGFCNPVFNLDGATNRYVRMKVRRHGSNTSSWVGRCSYEVLPDPSTDLHLQGSDEQTANLHQGGILGHRSHNMVLNGDLQQMNSPNNPRYWRAYPTSGAIDPTTHSQVVFTQDTSTTPRPGSSTNYTTATLVDGEVVYNTTTRGVAKLEIKHGGTSSAGEGAVLFQTSPRIDTTANKGSSLQAPIKNGHRYRIGFWAKASARRTIAVTLQKDLYNHNKYITRTGINVGPHWQYYEFEDVVRHVYAGPNDATARNLINTEQGAAYPGERNATGDPNLDYPADYEEELSKLTFLLGNRPDEIYSDTNDNGNTSPSAVGSSTVWLDDITVTHMPFGSEEDSTTSHSITANTILHEPESLQNVPDGAVGPWDILEWDMWSGLGPNLIGENYGGNPGFNMKEGIVDAGTWSSTPYKGSVAQHWRAWSTHKESNVGVISQVVSEDTPATENFWDGGSFRNSFDKVLGTYAHNDVYEVSGKVSLSFGVGSSPTDAMIWPTVDGKSYTFDSVSGDTYRIQFWAKIDGWSSYSIPVYLRTPSGTIRKTESLTITDDWVQYTFYHTFTASEEINLIFAMGGVTVALMLDEVTIRKVLTTTSPWATNKIGKMKFELVEGKRQIHDHALNRSTPYNGHDEFEIAWIETGSESIKDKPDVKAKLILGNELHEQVIADHTSAMNLTGSVDHDHLYGDHFSRSTTVGAWTGSSTTSVDASTVNTTPIIHTAADYDSGAAGMGVLTVNPNFTTANVANVSTFQGVPGDGGSYGQIQTMRLDRNSNLWIGNKFGLGISLANTGNENQSSTLTDYRMMVDVAGTFNEDHLAGQTNWGDNLTGQNLAGEDMFNVSDLDFDDLTQDCYALNRGGVFALSAFRFLYQPQILKTLAPTVDSVNTAIGSTYGDTKTHSHTGRAPLWKGARTSTIVANTTLWTNGVMPSSEASGYANNRMSWGLMANSSHSPQVIQAGWKHIAYDNKDRVIYLTTTGDQPLETDAGANIINPYAKANGAVWRIDSQTGNAVCLTHGLVEVRQYIYNNGGVHSLPHTYFGPHATESVPGIKKLYEHGPVPMGGMQQPWDIAVSPLDEHVYFSCKTSNNVFKISPARWKIPGVTNVWSGLSNTITTITEVANTDIVYNNSDGFPHTSSAAEQKRAFASPTSLRFSTSANTFGYLYVGCGDYSNSIVEIRPNGNTFIVANGAGFKSGSGITSQTLTPVISDIDANGSLYITVTGTGATSGGDRVWKVEHPFVDTNRGYRATFSNYTQVVNTHITASRGTYTGTVIKPTKI